MGQTRKVAVFSVGNEYFCVPVELVHHIVVTDSITPVPGKDNRGLLGVTNLSGRVVPVFDLHQWLGIEPVPQSKRHAMVIETRSGGTVALMVNAVLQLKDVPESELFGGVDAVGGVESAKVHGIVRDGERLIVHLNLSQFLGGEQT